MKDPDPAEGGARVLEQGRRDGARELSGLHDDDAALARGGLRRLLARAGVGATRCRTAWFSADAAIEIAPTRAPAAFERPSAPPRARARRAGRPDARGAARPALRRALRRQGRQRQRRRLGEDARSLRLARALPHGRPPARAAGRGARSRGRAPRAPEPARAQLRAEGPARRRRRRLAARRSAGEEPRRIPAREARADSGGAAG